MDELFLRLLRTTEQNITTILDGLTLETRQFCALNVFRAMFRILADSEDTDKNTAEAIRRVLIALEQKLK